MKESGKQSYETILDSTLFSRDYCGFRKTTAYNLQNFPLFNKGERTPQVLACLSVRRVRRE